MQTWRKFERVSNQREITTLWIKGHTWKLRWCWAMQYLFVSVEGGAKNSLSPLTSVEEEKLNNRPDNWRLACQTLINSSAVILTKPQSPPSNLKDLKKSAESKKLPR